MNNMELLTQYLDNNLHSQHRNKHMMRQLMIIVFLIPIVAFTQSIPDSLKGTWQVESISQNKIEDNDCLKYFSIYTYTLNNDGTYILTVTYSPKVNSDEKNRTHKITGQFSFDSKNKTLKLYNKKLDIKGVESEDNYKIIKFSKSILIIDKCFCESEGEMNMKCTTTLKKIN